MTDLARGIVGALVFAGFVAGAQLVTRPTAAGRPSRFRVSIFLIYCLGVSAMVGFSRRQLYPFHHWSLYEVVLPDTVIYGLLVAVDSAGVEHEIDYRAWHPMNIEDVDTWAHRSGGFFSLDSAAQRRTAEYLIRHLEAARRRARAGEGIGRNRRFLGPFAAPTFVLFRAIWTEPEQVPDAPFVALRWVLEGWRPVGPGRTDNRISRVIRHEVRLEP